MCAQKFHFKRYADQTRFFFKVLLNKDTLTVLKTHLKLYTVFMHTYKFRKIVLSYIYAVFAKLLLSLDKCQLLFLYFQSRCCDRTL